VDQTPIQAVLLDFDGTLADSEPLHYDCWAQTLKPHGVRLSWPEYHRRLVGVADGLVGRMLLEEAGIAVSDNLAALVLSEKKSLYRRRVCDEVTIPPGVLEFVGALSAKLPVGVVSSSLTPEVEPLLVQVGLRSGLALLVCGEQVSRLKPDPEPYLRALGILNQNVNPNGGSVTAAGCLVFEDSDSGVTSATAAGMTVERVSSPDRLLEALDAHLGGLLALKRA
jgi:beta-phosphoglucomutase-like phosphatase (HAD superfamily)